MLRLIVIFLLWPGLCAAANAAASPRLEKMTLDVNANGVVSATLQFDIPVAAQVGVTSNGDAVRIDIPHAQLAQSYQTPRAIAPVKAIRLHNGSDKLGLKLALAPARGDRYRLSSSGQGKQVRVRLRPMEESAAVAAVPAAADKNKNKSAKSATPPAMADTVKYDSKTRPQWVVAIDAGHGGKDTGAIGSAGIREKDVVLSIAKKLSTLINAEPNMKAVMVRKGDAFIDLAHRAEIARNAHADLFVSLHADAYIHDDVRGSSVFTLSEHGASSVAAKWLADRENAADLVGGVKLRDKNKLLASVLLDLSQSAAMKSSDRAARRILRALEKKHGLHHHDIQKAGFVVLKSPDMPSVLVETAFISNPADEKNLIDERYQIRIASSIFEGIRSYFGRNKESQGMTADSGGSSSSAVLAALQP
ncbi:N-acetylmuramoyl-L-alanine amidase [Candidatus Methylospira mobilis]|nr:N-acetylmuramoyl-L-alanine amidase [Candidatus Methylospira mobilis]WNV03640.1 N-acetylmuramoyl-L-alanine amidase [Candidatus Methylospira mobilis]